MAKKPKNKTEALLRMLQRKRGATLAQMQESTGWKPDSIRGWLARQRQDVALQRETNARGTSVYRIG